MVSSEAVPFSKSGGLADVVGSLSLSLKKAKNDTRIIVPAYGTPADLAGDFVASFDVQFPGRTENVQIRMQRRRWVRYYFLCHPWFCSRKGIYGDTSFTPYADNFKRFSLLCKASLELCKVLKWKPDIIHCHDWATGLVPYFIRFAGSFFATTKVVFTIHNLAYKGSFPPLEWLQCGERPSEKCFADGRVNMMRTALEYSDYITTVSPTYASEIQMQSNGCGMESILVRRKKYFKGIVNGIDVREWNPMKDKLIHRRFNPDNLRGKARLKRDVQKKFNLPVEPSVPLFAMISRLASQKGFDVLLSVLESILRNNRLQFVIIGTGDSSLERSLTEMGERNANLSVNIIFSNEAAHLVEAGADFFLMPSRYEPCGLNQLYSLRYGTIPIVHKTGGLADTVVDIDEYPKKGTGLVFEDLTPETIAAEVARAAELYNNPDFEKTVRRAMLQDFSWESSAEEYLKVYAHLTGKREE